MQVILQSQKNLNKIVEVLKDGKIVICPTDTVYGFLADATNKKAVAKIYKIKGRSKDKPLPLFVADLQMADQLASLTKDQKKLCKKYWPGPYTLVLDRKQKKGLYGVDKKSLALRIPGYPFLQSVVKRMQKPLAQTSVNVSGSQALLSIEKIILEFGDKDILLIDGGKLKKAKSSKILDIRSNKIKVLRS